MKRLKNIFKSSLVKNSAWGIVANILQVIFVSFFFIILARKYPTTIFAQFLIASTVYQLIAAFSSLGLGQWFIREFENNNEKVVFIAKFLKVQFFLGLVFYIINVILSYILYGQSEIRILSLILGVNIVFDNLIYGIKNLNIAEQKQKKTFLILTIDSFLKLFIGCLLFITSLSIINITILLIVVRFFTLNLFLNIGCSASINLKLLRRASITLHDLKIHVLSNWRFILIGSISIIYWRISNIIISKLLTLHDIANYEIAFRIFSIQLMIPIIGASTVYPQFIKYWNAGNKDVLKTFYNKMFVIYNLYAFLTYIFIYSFADVIILYAFGAEYKNAAECLRQMFLTAIIFPTVLLQANLIISMRMEKADMWFNIISVALNIFVSIIGLMYVKSIAVVNYSICFSFIVFHILQSILLAQKKFASLKGTLLFYLSTPAIVIIYQFMNSKFDNLLVFIIASVIIISLAFIILAFIQKKSTSKILITPALSRFA